MAALLRHRTTRWLFYGLANTGIAGVNEVQRVTVSNAGAGTFTLTYTALPGGPAQRTVTATTAPIAWNAPATPPPGAPDNSVQSALTAILGAGNFAVASVRAGVYDITFTGVLAASNLNLLTADNTGLTPPAGAALPVPQPTVTVIYQQRGQSENGAAPGDSGAPLLIPGGPNGQMQIAGVQSALLNTQQPPELIGAPNFYSFGNIGGATRVSDYTDSFINPNMSVSHGLVLDMNYQMLGVDGTNDPLTITASLGGAGNANLIINVTDPNSPQYTGDYFVGAAANITSLTIRGATIDTNTQTFQINGNLGVGPVTIVGGGGTNNNLIYNDATDANATTDTITATQIQSLSGQLINYSSNTMQTITVITGSGYDTVNVQSTSIPTTIINGNEEPGTGVVNVGVFPTNTLNEINGRLTIQCAAGTNNSLNINDQGTQGPRNYQVTGSTIAHEGGPFITYQGFMYLTLNCAAGNEDGTGNTIDIFGTSATTKINAERTTIP